MPIAPDNIVSLAETQRSLPTSLDGIEADLLETCRPFVNLKADDRTLRAAALTVSQRLRVMVEVGLLPDDTDCRVGWFVFKSEPQQAIMWLSDELQRLLWGEVRVRETDHVTMRMKRV